MSRSGMDYTIFVSGLVIIACLLGYSYINHYDTGGVDSVTKVKEGVGHDQREYMLLEANGAWTVIQGDNKCSVYVHVGN